MGSSGNEVGFENGGVLLFAVCRMREPRDSAGMNETNETIMIVIAIIIIMKIQ